MAAASPLTSVAMSRRDLHRVRAAQTGNRASGELLDLLDGDLSDDEVLADVVRRLADHPATTQARDEAVRWAREAVAALDPLPPSPARDALRAYAEAVVARTA